MQRRAQVPERSSPRQQRWQWYYYNKSSLPPERRASDEDELFKRGLRGLKERPFVSTAGVCVQFNVYTYFTRVIGRFYPLHSLSISANNWYRFSDLLSAHQGHTQGRERVDKESYSMEQMRKWNRDIKFIFLLLYLNRENRCISPILLLWWVDKPPLESPPLSCKTWDLSCNLRSLISVAFVERQ